MHPIAFHIFGHPIHWYGIMAGIGFLSAVWFAQRKRDYAELTEDQVINVFVLTMLFAIIGARVYFIIAYWNTFQDASLMKYFAIWEGGLVYFGGFICASTFMILYTYFKNVNILKVMDLFAVTLPLGHFFGRIGCFLQGCCFGAPTHQPWGVVYPSTMAGESYLYKDIMEHYKGIPIHPVQLYEALVILCVFFIGTRFFNKLKPGRSAALYFILYGIGRFFVEGYRGEYSPDKITKIGSLSLYPGQMDSLTIIIPAGILIWIIAGVVAKYRAKKDAVAIEAEG